MPGRAMGDEIDAGRRRRFALYFGRVDLFAAPELHQQVAEAVGAEQSDVAGLGALARRGDRRVGRVAAEAGFVERVVRLLVELDHGFAETDEIGHRDSSAVVRRPF